MKIDLRLHVMSFKNNMQIYQRRSRRLLTTFSPNKLDKPSHRDTCYFDAIFNHNEEEEWLEFDTDRES